MEFGVTTEHILDCCNVKYTEPPYGFDHIRTGFSVADFHYIRAREYIQKHSPPRDEFELCQLNPAHDDYQISKLITVKQEVFPHWQPNSFQQDYIVNYREKLAEEYRCVFCGLFPGSYCKQQCRPPTPNDSPGGPASYRRRKKNHKRNLRKKTSRKQQFRGQDQTTSGKEPK